jgi:anti-sigma B factor antagonist
MLIDERSVDDVTILDLKGRLILGEGTQVLYDKAHSLANQGRRFIVLNLADVHYVDSAGIGEIVRTHTTVTNIGGRVKLLHVTKRIHDLLVITKLLTVFDTYDAETEAVRSFPAAV